MKENECNDSDGKRAKSSVNGSVGEAGPAIEVNDVLRDGALEANGERGSLR